MEPDRNIKTLHSISLLAQHNDQLTDDFEPIIYADSGIILFRLPASSTNTNTETFILDFDIEGFSQILIDNTSIESGVTPFLFGNNVPHRFTIVATDGTEEHYTIKLVERFEGYLQNYNPNTIEPELPTWHYNNPDDVILYATFNSRVEDISADNFNFGSSISDLEITPVSGSNNRIFTIRVSFVDPTSLSDGVYSISFNPDTPVREASDPGDYTAPGNLRTAENTSFIIDRTPPEMSSVPIVLEMQYADDIRLRCNAATDPYSNDNNYITYNLYFSESNDTTMPIDLDLGNFESDGRQSAYENFHIHMDSSITLEIDSVSRIVEDNRYKFVLLATDLAGNISITSNLYVDLQSAVYVSTEGNDSTANGNKTAPFRNIQPALDYAFNQELTEVRVAEGTYYPDPDSDGDAILDRDIALRLYPDMKVTGGFSSDFISHNPSDYETILSGDIDKNDVLDFGNSEHLIYIDSDLSSTSDHSDLPNNHSILQDLTLTEGYSTSPTNAGGGAIATTEGFELINIQFLNNRAVNGGGAIFLKPDLGTQDIPFMIISESLFEQNETIISNEKASTGGAVYIEDGQIDFYGCNFVNNLAQQGGAIYVIEGTRDFNTSLYSSGRSSYSNNHAVSMGVLSDEGLGGAIYYSADYRSQLYGSTFTQNTADLLGGAVYITDSRFRISDSVFQNNSSEINGGALYSQDSFIELYYTDFFSNNSVVNGGAVFLDNPEPNSLIVGNYFLDNGDEGLPNQSGGAIAMANLTKSFSISRNVFHHNLSQMGSAIYLNNLSLSITPAVLRITCNLFLNQNQGEFTQNKGSTLSFDKGDSTILNNLFYNNHSSDDLGRDISGAEGSKINAENNVFYYKDVTQDQSFISIQSNSTFSYDYNLFYSNSSESYNSIIDISSSTETPGYNNRISTPYIHPEWDPYPDLENLSEMNIHDPTFFSTSSSFYPTATSSVIDSGTAQTNLPYDMIRDPRVSGADMDLGPYEYQQ